MKLTREQKAEKYRALPIAKVIKPLKYIGAQLNYFDKEKKETVVNPVFTVAERLAARGDGMSIQNIARLVYTQQGALV